MTLLMLNALLVFIGLPLIVGAMTLIAAVQMPELVRRPKPTPPMDVTSGWIPAAAWA